MIIRSTIKIPSIRSILQNVGLGFLYFFFLYSVQFIFVPGGLGTRVMYGMAGAILLVKPILQGISDGRLMIDKALWRIILSFGLIAIFAIFTNLINGTSERSFFTYIISSSIILLGGYFVIYVTQRIYGTERTTFELVSKYLIGCVVVQVCLALLMFILPSVRNLLLNIQYQMDYSMELFSLTEGVRLIGFGSQFFGAGITNGFALILIGTLFRLKQPPLKHGWLFVCFVIITVLGSVMARTTLVGSGIGLLIMIWNSNFLRLKITSRFRRVVFASLVMTGIGWAILGILPESSRDTVDTAMEYGFEMVYNYIETGEATTASTNELSQMYDIYPTNLKTWVIGDGLWLSDPSDPLSYAAGVDVGHIRLIFYFGLSGLIIYFIYQFFLLKAVDDRTDSKYRSFLIWLFIYCIVLNFKGHTDIIQYVAIFLFLPKLNNDHSTKNLDNNTNL